MNYCVYFLLDDGVIVYIGQTSKIRMRISAHSMDKEFDEVRIIYVDSKERALHYEKRLIIYFQPELNSNLWDETVVIRVTVSKAERIRRFEFEMDEMRKELYKYRPALRRKSLKETVEKMNKENGK